MGNGIDATAGITHKHAVGRRGVVGCFRNAIERAQIVARAGDYRHNIARKQRPLVVRVPCVSPWRPVGTAIDGFINALLIHADIHDGIGFPGNAANCRESSGQTRVAQYPGGTGIG